MLVGILWWGVIATITGLIVGSGVSLFLHVLHFGMDLTAQTSLYIKMILLPIGGILNGLILYYGYRKSKDLKDSTIAAVHEQSGILPIKSLPLKPIAAIITLASGGSAGKEGPCSHIGGTLASFVGRVLHLNPEFQKKIVACGVSAGFASVFGTPIAGAIYGVEVLTIGRIRHDYIFPAFFAGVISFEVSKLWGINYSYFPFSSPLVFSETLFFKVIIIGILCGIVSWLFIELFEEFKLLFKFIQFKFQIWPPIMPFIGGLILSVLILFIPTDYLGLSLPLMESALHGDQVPYVGFLLKILLVAITLSSGFYGGIVTPQFVIGALAGNTFAIFFNVDPALGAAVGMVSVVASASNTPIAAIFMGFELFGAQTGIYVVAACITAYIMIGHRSVYPDQLVAFSKSNWMNLLPNISLEKEDIHLSYSFLRKMRRFQRQQKDFQHRYKYFRNKN
jgi:H+/Cl- antiporter ClcA